MPAKPSTIMVVVFPSLSLRPDLIVRSIETFKGRGIVVIVDENCPARGIPAEVEQALARLPDSVLKTILSSAIFGDRSGFILPVDLAVRIGAGCAIDPLTDRIRLTGCYRGEGPGSLDVLAHAMADMHYCASIDPTVPRR